MPKDRRQDRHNTKARIIRPDPENLWDQLGMKVGVRNRNKTISSLMAAYLAGRIQLPNEEAPPAE